MAIKKIGCKTKGGCLLSIIVFIISVVLISGISFNFISTSLYQKALEELGFKSEKEFDEFSEKMNQPFDDTTILIDVPTELDGNNAKQILSTSLILTNGEDVILDNGKMNVDAMQTGQDVTVVADMNFTSQQLAYAINLILISSQADDIDLAQDVQLKQIDYQYISPDKAHFNFYLDIDTSGIAKEIGKLGKFVPERLLINIGETLTVNASNEVVATNCNLKFNQLDEETNAKFLDVLARVMNKTSAEVEQWAGDLVASVFNDFCAELDCKMIFSSDIITITKVIQGE